MKVHLYALLKPWQYFKENVVDVAGSLDHMAGIYKQDVSFGQVCDKVRVQVLDIRLDDSISSFILLRYRRE